MARAKHRYKRTNDQIDKFIRQGERQQKHYETYTPRKDRARKEVEEAQIDLPPPIK